jgi:multiple sugar transport system substrate-binding protein
MLRTSQLNRRELIQRTGAVTGGALALSLGAGRMPAPAAAQEGKLTFWSALNGSKEAARNQLIAAFEQANPNITIEHEGISPEDLNQKLLTAMVGGTVPDLVCNHFYYAVNYADAGQLEPLDGFMEEIGLAPDEIEPVLLKTGIWSGQTYGLPLYGTSRALLYNRTMVTEAGLNPEQPPGTWDELREWSRRLTRRDGDRLTVQGFGLPTSQGEGLKDLFTLLLRGAGGDVMTSDGETPEPTFNGPEGVSALEYMLALLYEDEVTDIGFGENQVGLESPFNTNRCAIILGGNFSAYLARQAEIDFGIALLPARDGGSVSFADPFNLFIPKNAPNKDAAKQLVAFAMSEEQQVAFSVGSTNLPALESAQEAPEITGDEDLRPFVEALTEAEPPPITPVYSEMWSIIGAQLEQALYRQKSPEEALDAAAAEVAPLFDR